MPFLIENPVEESSIPKASIKRQRVNQFDGIYKAVAQLKRGKVLPVRFDSEKEALYCRSQLTSMSEREGEVVSSFRSGEDRLRFFFYLEDADDAKLILEARKQRRAKGIKPRKKAA